MTKFTRRDFVALAPGIALVPSLPVRAWGAAGPSSGPTVQTDAKPWVGFPRQDAALVKEIVGASHAKEDRVRELVALRPALVNARWDWGFGDWESPLGAASHTGRRSIAEFLIANGARLDIFAAAMLGMTQVVTAMVAASPGVQRTLGPHGITLLAHAQAGGDAAKETAAYLESLGDAGTPLPTTELAETQREVYVGEYRFGQCDNDRFTVRLSDRKQLMLGTGSESPQRIHFVGNDEFFPSGVPNVRIKFKLANGRAESLTIVEREFTIAAARVSG